MSVKLFLTAGTVGLAIGCMAARYGTRTGDGRIPLPAERTSSMVRMDVAHHLPEGLSKWVAANSSIPAMEHLSDADLPGSIRWIRNQPEGERAGLFALFLDRLTSDFPQGIPQVIKLLSPGDAAPASLIRALNASASTVPAVCAELVNDPALAEGSPWAQFLAENRQKMWPFWHQISPVLFSQACKLGRIPELWGWQTVAGGWLNAASESPEPPPLPGGPIPDPLQALVAAKQALQGSPPENWLEQLGRKFEPPGPPENLSEQEEKLYGDTLAAYLCRHLDSTNLSSLLNSAPESPLLPKIALARMGAELGAGTSVEAVAAAISESTVAAWSPADLHYASADLARDLFNPFVPIGSEIEALQSVPVAALRQAIAEAYFKEASVQDAVGLSVWLSQSEPGEMRDHVAFALVMELKNDPYAQAQWASQISDPALRQKAAEIVNPKKR